MKHILALSLLTLATSCAVHKRDSPQVLDAAAPAQLTGLELLWSVSLGSNRLAGGVTSDPIQGAVYVLPPAFKGQEFDACVQISADGKVDGGFKYTPHNRRVCVARLRSSTARDLLLFSSWSRYVVACDVRGSNLWIHEKRGIDDVWIADLDGDGLDEVIVGYVGYAGLHVLGGNGNVLWKNQVIGNVWSVCAADLNGDGKSEVVTTSASGKVHVFKSDGTRMPDIEPPPGYYGYVVRPITLSDGENSDGIFLTGHKTRIAALKGDGSLAWEVEMATGPNARMAQPAPGKPWLAMPSGSRMVVLDTRTGAIIAEASNRWNSHLCWLELRGQSSPLLILSTPRSIEAYRLTNEERIDAPDRAAETEK